MHPSLHFGGLLSYIFECHLDCSKLGTVCYDISLVLSEHKNLQKKKSHLIITIVTFNIQLPHSNQNSSSFQGVILSLLRCFKEVGTNIFYKLQQMNPVYRN